MDPEEIESREFLPSFRGYAREEVEAFREEVVQELKSLRKQLTKATSDLSHANTELAQAKAQLAAVRAELAEERSRPQPASQVAGPEPSPADERAAQFRMVGQETERILLAAEQAAEQIHEQAVKESAEMMTDARLKVQRSLEELEAARRATEEDFASIRESRGMVASQLEDIRRRLEETINRLRVPVELPGAKPVSRFRPQPEGGDRPVPPVPVDRVKEAEIQALQRRAREREAAQELQARQTAHRAEARRREKELRAAQAQAEIKARADAERLAAENAQRAAAARKDQEDASRRAAARAEIDSAARAQAEKTAQSEAERAAETEAERAAAEKADAERLAAEKARAEEQAQERKAAEEAAARTAATAKAPETATTTSPAKGADRSSKAAGSSLDDLLEEIRRKREEERSSETSEPAGAAAGGPEVPPEAPAAPPVAQAGVPEALAQRSEALGDLPSQTARRLKRLLQEDHNDLLDRLRTRRGKGALEDNLAPVEEQLRRFHAGLNEALGRAFSEGRRAAGATGETDASAAVNKLVSRQVLNPLRAEVSKAVAAGLAAEDSASALSERANDVFRVWKGVRTQLLGEGIAYAAYHQGQLDAWRSTPDSRKVWVLATDEQECPNDVCRRNAEVGAVDLKTPFPSGHMAPPAHGACTCTLQRS